MLTLIRGYAAQDRFQLVCCLAIGFFKIYRRLDSHAFFICSFIMDIIGLVCLMRVQERWGVSSWTLILFMASHGIQMSDSPSTISLDSARYRFIGHLVIFIMAFIILSRKCDYGLHLAAVVVVTAVAVALPEQWSSASSYALSFCIEAIACLPQLFVTMPDRFGSPPRLADQMGSYAVASFFVARLLQFQDYWCQGLLGHGTNIVASHPFANGGIWPCVAQKCGGFLHILQICWLAKFLVYFAPSFFRPGIFRSDIWGLKQPLHVS